MAVRKPLVSVAGQIQEIPSGDTISGTADKADLAGSLTQDFTVSHLGISTATNSAYGLISSATLSGNSNQFGNTNNVTFGNDVTIAFGYDNYNFIPAAEITVSSWFNYIARSGSLGTGAIVTSRYSFYGAADVLATNCYGFYGLNSATPENNRGTTSTITEIAVTSNVVTVTTTAAHGLTAGTSRVTITPTINTQLRGSGILVASTPSSTSFTYARTTADVASDPAESGSVVPQTRWNLYMVGTAPNYLAGSLFLSAGTAALPILTKDGDADTGLYFPAANEVALSAAGAQVIKATATGIVVTGSVTATTAITSSGGTSGIGYAAGAGGAVTQITSRTTGVTLNKITGEITLVSAAGSATPASFTVTNSAMAATDLVVVNQKSGTDLYEVFITAKAAGSFRITFYTTGGTTTEQPVFSFAIIKGVAA